jgi:hypothetical protein
MTLEDAMRHGIANQNAMRNGSAQKYVTSVRRSRANDILKLIASETALLRELEGKVIKFLKDHGCIISNSSARRYVRAIEEANKNQHLIIQWVEDKLPAVLTENAADPNIIAKIKELLSTPIEKYIENNTSAVPSTDAVNAPSSGPHKDAIELLLGMSQGAHYHVSDFIAGEYFGYRRSANHGSIIRFYIAITNSAETGLLRFRNRFRRGVCPWTVDGFGLNVGEVTYLMGQAKTDIGKQSNFGLRFFALKQYRSFGWCMGPLISMDDEADPIAARVVLVPAEQHKTFQKLAQDERDDEILRLIENRVTPDEIDKDIELLDRYGKTAFHQIPPSIHIQALIWNASFSTLHARQGKINQATADEYKKLFELQRRAIEFGRSAKDGMAAFMQIAARAEDILPINNR